MPALLARSPTGRSQPPRETSPPPTRLALDRLEDRTTPAGPGLVGYTGFATGADAGGDALVTLYDSSGTPQFTINPFPGFTGGVRVASADFNGDGVPDVLVGTGPGVAAQVELIDGATQAVLFRNAPFELSFTGGVFVSAGDVSGDGTPDIVVSADVGGGPRVRVFSGKTYTQIADFFGIADPNFRGGARTTVADLNGDGYSDLVVAAGDGGGPRVALYDGKSLAAGKTVKLANDFFAFEPSLRNGAYVAAGDLNGDGFADVIAGGGPSGGPRVTVFDGKSLLSNSVSPVANFFAGDPANRGGIRVAAKNLDGDNLTDLVVGSGTGAGSQVTAYLGNTITPTGTSSPDLSFDAYPGFSGGVFVG